MTLSRALTRSQNLAAALGRWSGDGDISVEPEALRWAAATAASLVVEVMRLQKTLEEQQLWSFPDHPFARAAWGKCVHVRGCFVTVGAACPQPLTRSQAEGFLRESHEHRRCRFCQPDIADPTWVRRRSAGGQVRWRLADDVDPGEAL